MSQVLMIDNATGIPHLADRGMVVFQVSNGSRIATSDEIARIKTEGSLPIPNRPHWWQDAPAALLAALGLGALNED